MGSLRTPVGPLPSTIYWRRRAVVLGLVALVALLVLWALRPGGGGDEERAGADDAGGGPAESLTPGPTPSESLIDERPGGGDRPSDDDGDGTGDGQDAEPGGTGEAGEAGEAGGEGREGAGSGAEPDQGTGGENTGGSAGGVDPASLEGCEPSEITLTLRSDANEYDPGVEPELRLTVENTSATSCRVDLGHGALTLKVTDVADEPVWDWAACPTGPASAPTVVPAQGSASWAVTWDRASCQAPEGEGPPAGPGTYIAKAKLPGGEPEVQTSFRLDED